jgi:putative SOS response-associated peptidase YedK
MRGAKH